MVAWRISISSPSRLVSVTLVLVHRAVHAYHRDNVPGNEVADVRQRIRSAPGRAEGTLHRAARVLARSLGATARRRPQLLRGLPELLQHPGEEQRARREDP